MSAGTAFDTELSKVVFESTLAKAPDDLEKLQMLMGLLLNT